MDTVFLNLLGGAIILIFERIIDKIKHDLSVVSMIRMQNKGLELNEILLRYNRLSNAKSTDEFIFKWSNAHGQRL